MKHLSILLALCMAIFATSCDNDEDKMEVTATFNQFYAVYNPTSANFGDFCSSATFTYEIDYSDGTIDIIANGISFSPMMQIITMEIDDVPFSYSASVSSSADIVLNGSNIVPKVGGQKISEYTITRISGKIGSSQVANGSLASLTFVVNDLYTVTVYPSPSIFEYNSTTQVHKLLSSDSNGFTSSDIYYALSVNTSTNLADLYLYNVKFAEKMPAMNMLFKDIAISSENSQLILKADDLTPYVVGDTGATTPAPNYAITNLSGTISNEKLELYFFCDITAEGSVQGMTFGVNSNAYMYSSSKTSN